MEELRLKNERLEAESLAREAANEQLLLDNSAFCDRNRQLGQEKEELASRVSGGLNAVASPQ